MSNPVGRVQGSVNQSGGGTFYPFIDPSQDIEFLIDDLFFYFEDDRRQFKSPYSVKTLYGFGTESAAAASWPNDHDVIISDGTGAEIFDTRVGTVTYRYFPFGPHKAVIEWVDLTAQIILRVVIFTHWDDYDTPITWPEWFDVDNGILAASASQRRAPALDQIAVATDLQNPAADILLEAPNNVVIRTGYNSAIETEELVEGAQRIVQLSLNADPGAGLGRVPGCDDVRFVRRINGVVADSAGNLRLMDDGCVRTNLPLSSEPANLGIYSGEVRQSTVTPNSLLVDSDCGVCTDCQDFINTYEAIRRLSDKYKSLGARAEAVRDLYAINKQRWEDNRICRAGTQLRVAMQPLAPCLAAVGIGICNQTGANLEGISLQLGFVSSSGDACVICDSSFRRGNVSPTGPPPAQSVPYKLGGSWPDFTAGFDCISTGEIGYIGFHLNAENCVEGQTITLTLEGSSGAITFPAFEQVVTLLPARDTINCCEVGTTPEPTTTAP